MIQIDEIWIREFRGIRDLHLRLNGESFVVWGPNGTGKSGVVDAVEFALTGDVSRLSGSGSGGVTLSKHAPHVHSREDPQKAIVAMKVRDTSSGESSVITRTVLNPSIFLLEPEIQTVRSAVESAARHPEITLSRREIIKYIITTPGDRSKEVQALLKLDRLGSVRTSLRSAKSKTAAALKAFRRSEEDARGSMGRHLDVADFSSDDLLEVVNQRRLLLGLGQLEAADDTTNLSAGAGAGDEAGGNSFNRDSALRDVDALLTSVTEQNGCVGTSGLLEESLQALDDDPGVLGTLKTRKLVEEGISQVVDEHCPLCGLAWEDMVSLQAHLAEMLRRSEQAEITCSAILAEAKQFALELNTVADLAKSVHAVADRLEETEVSEVLDGWIDAIDEVSTELASIDGIIASRTALKAEPTFAPEGVIDELRAFRERVAGTPDQATTTEATTFLTIAQERWQVLHSALADERTGMAADVTAQVIYDHYCDALDQGLALLYQQVQERFSEFYRAINCDDEGEFKASLEPFGQKLDLVVDFYGLGMFPPVAYHSEGHQDGMGVCLYLALMDNLLGDEFRLAILDDVVMSIDVNHRRQFCALLKTFFPKVQFIITTHDEVWARQMARSGLIAKDRQVHFINWNVDDGPALMEGEDFWERIDHDLDTDDVSAAAARLRRNFEAALADLAGELMASVPYRVGGGWDLGELMNAVKGRYGRLLKAAAAAANSWNDEEARTKVNSAKEKWVSASLAQETEQWAVNPAVHYNEWANLATEDFRPVVDACRAFLDLFRCGRCETQVHVSRANGRDESLGCTCGEIRLNLVGK